MVDRTYAIGVTAETPLDEDGYYVILPSWAEWIEWTIQVAATFEAVLLVSRTIGTSPTSTYPVRTQQPNIIAIPFASVGQNQPPLRTAFPSGFNRYARFRVESDVENDIVQVGLRMYAHRWGLSCAEHEALGRLLGWNRCDHAAPR